MKFDIDVRAGTPPVAVPQARPAAGPTKTQERLAWLVIWGAFFVCVLVAVSLPLGGRHFLLYAVEAKPSTIQAISPNEAGCGTVRFTPPNATQPTAVTCDPASFPEGSTVETDQTSRGFITFFDGTSVAQISSSSRLVMTEMRQPRFDWSELSSSVRIRQEKGLVLYAVAPAVPQSGNPNGRAITLRVDTHSFSAILGEGSYSIEVTDKDAQIVVTRGGPAVVQSADGMHAVSVEQGERVQVALNQALPAPIPAAQDLIVDGSFSSDIPSAGWLPFYDQGGDAGDVNGSLSITSVDNRRALHIVRSGAGTNSAITGIRQVLNKDVWNFNSLVFSADVRLHQQSLSGGGYQSTEYPLIIRLRYRDVNGNEQETVQGFYYQNEDSNPTKNGERIPQDKWIPYQTSNLLKVLDPRPFYLLYIEVYASGWDYDGFVSGIHLTAE